MPGLTQSQRQRFALALAVVVLVHLAPRPLVDVWKQRPFGIVGAPGTEQLRDITSHLRMVRLTLQGEFVDGAAHEASLYSPEAHVKMTSEWVGRPMARALPFGYSPTMVWVLAPFALWPDPWAYLLWTLVGFALLAWLLWPHEGWPLVAGLVFLSPLAAWSVLNGQTALYSNAVLLLLATPGVNVWVRTSRQRVVSDAALLWLLTAKPPVAVMAGAALLAVGRWRAVGLALVLTAASTAVVSPLLGAGWAADYINLARGYNSKQAAPAFAWCLAPEYMTNLRAGLWHLGAPDAAASLWCAIGWVSVTGLVTVAGWRGWLSEWAVWCLALLAFLLLSPHVNMTEDLQLHAGAVIAFAAIRSPARLAGIMPTLFVACSWATSLAPLGPGPWWPWPALIGKGALAGAVVVMARVNSNAVSPVPHQDGAPGQGGVAGSEMPTM